MKKKETSEEGTLWKRSVCQKLIENESNTQVGFHASFATEIVYSDSWYIDYDASALISRRNRRGSIGNTPKKTHI